jgi:hypothetical protein
MDLRHLVRGDSSTIRKVSPTGSYEFSLSSAPMHPGCCTGVCPPRYFRFLIKLSGP